MNLPLVTSLAVDSPASVAGVAVGDVLTAINGQQPRDVIAYQLLVDAPEVVLDIDRGGMAQTIEINKAEGEPMGIEVQSSLFDQVRTCDNHCEFCFIYQLPPGMRKSLYLKDDDFRLSFLYGNFTTLTRFTEADLERVISEGLSPLYVSIHSTDPDLRSEMLRNRRGGTSLRWLRALLDAGIEVHGQLVVCPGVNSGEELERTLVGVLDEYPELASLAVVPLGISDHSNESRMRDHSRAEATMVTATVERWQKRFLALLGHRLVFAADEYYILSGQDFPDANSYEGFAMHEDGIGMARTFEAEFNGEVSKATGTQAGFFASVDGAPAEGYRSQRVQIGKKPKLVEPWLEPGAPIGILTGAYGAAVLAPLVDSLERLDVRLLIVENRFFGGNIAVTGLMVGSDVDRVLSCEPEGQRYLLPDVCLSNGKFLDGMSLAELSRPVEVLPTDGLALRAALEKEPAKVSV